MWKKNPIDELEHLWSPCGDPRIMSGHDQSVFEIGLELDQKVDDLLSGARIEIPGGLVGQQ